MTQDTRNTPMMIAAGLTALGAAVHIWMGTPEILSPVLASSLDLTVQAVLAVVWHAISALLIVFALATAWLVTHRNTALGITLLALNAGFVVLFLAYGVALLRSVWPMPQWILFTAIAAAMTLGLRRV